MSNNTAFNIMSMKTNNAKLSILMHKQNKELEIVTKTNELISRSPNHGGLSTKHPLKVMHPSCLLYTLWTYGPPCKIFVLIGLTI